MNKVIYIAGYGRSGSTLLSILLDNLPGVVGVGGIAGLPRYLGVRGRECSCNRSYSDCPFWNKVLESVPGRLGFLKELGELQRQIEPWNSGLGSHLREEVWQQYSKRTVEFLSAVSETSEARVLVDSSKSAHQYTWRPLALDQIANLDLFVVHLFRSAADVVASRKKGRNLKLELGSAKHESIWASVAGLAGWLTANLTALYIRRALDSEQSMVLQYKDLVESPKQEVERIVNRAGLTEVATGELLQRDRKLRVGHLVGGNRMARRNQEIEVKPPNSSSSRLSRIEGLIARTFGCPVERILKSEI